MRQPAPVSRRRIWPVLLPIGLAAVLAILWTGLWFYAAGKAQATIAGWREREERVGRTYACANQTIGGFPFRFEVSCADPVIRLDREIPPLVLKAGGLVGVAQVFSPTSLRADLKGPLSVAEAGQPPRYTANWTIGEASARGTPRAPERVSIIADEPRVDRLADAPDTVLRAKRIELIGRVAEGSAARNPVIDISLRVAAAAAPELHPIAAEPIDADISALLRGLPDLVPKPWRVLLRDLQTRGGTLEIANARVQQGETIAVAAGTLALTPRGGLEGQLEVTVAGLERVLKALDLDRIVSEGRIGARLDALDNIIPGLGRLARRNAAPGIVAGLGFIGQKTTLESRPAVTLPLRFADGEVSLGPIPVGRVPPLF